MESVVSGKVESWLIFVHACLCGVRECVYECVCVCVMPCICACRISDIRTSALPKCMLPACAKRAPGSALSGARQKSHPSLGEGTEGANNGCWPGAEGGREREGEGKREGKDERQGKEKLKKEGLGGGEQGSEGEEGQDMGTGEEGAGDWVRQGYRGAAAASFRANLHIPSSPSSDESILLSFTSTSTSTSSPSPTSISSAASPPAPLHMKGCDPRIFDTPVAVMNLPVCACECVTFDHQWALSQGSFDMQT